jgi:glutaredoxin-like YruB-family protein
METKNVKVYTSPTCFWCNTLKNFLNSKGVSYTDIDISRNEEAMAEMVSKSGKSGVPQIDINGQIIVGFSQQRISELLGIQ